MNKTCKKCGKEKSIEDFYKDKGFKDGYKATCKDCNNKIHKGTCELCKKEFCSNKKNQRYCSIECVANSKKKRINTNCDYCNNEFEIIECLYNKNKYHYCSKECRQKGHSNEIKGTNNGRYNSKTVKCDFCGGDIIRNESAIEDRNFCNTKCYSEYRKIHYSKENHSCWNPNLSDEEREDERKCDEYYEWRDSVFERDNYICQCCGIDTHKNNAHHLNSYSVDKENRFNINNGITLCEECHKSFHKNYGYRNNTKEQFYIWIKDKIRLIP